MDKQTPPGGAPCSQTDADVGTEEAQGQDRGSSSSSGSVQPQAGGLPAVSWPLGPSLQIGGHDSGVVLSSGPRYAPSPFTEHRAVPGPGDAEQGVAPSHLELRANLVVVGGAVPPPRDTTHPRTFWLSRLEAEGAGGNQGEGPGVLPNILQCATLGPNNQQSADPQCQCC